MSGRALLLRAAMVAGLVVSLAAVGSASGRVATDAPEFFYTPGPNGATCEIDVITPMYPKRTWCMVLPPKVRASKAIGATLTPSGRLRICHGQRCDGTAPAGTRTLRYGHSISRGPFRCTASKRGVHCVVKKLNYGFFLTRRDVTKE